VVSTGNPDNSITYAGYQYDKETKTYYLNARMYDPKTARFLQEDTYGGNAEDPLSLNRYTYCHNDPIKYTDPTGHWIFDPYTNQNGRKGYRMKCEIGDTYEQLGLALWGNSKYYQNAAAHDPFIFAEVTKFTSDMYKRPITAKEAGRYSPFIAYTDKIVSNYFNSHQGMVTSNDAYVRKLYDDGINQIMRYLNNKDTIPYINKFKTIDDAAICFADRYNRISILQNVEYGTQFYSFVENGVTYYSFIQPYTDGIRDSVNHSYFEDMTVLVGNKYYPLVAFGHTHGAYDWYYDVDNFSDIDGDKDSARKTGVPLYLATPGGMLKVFSASSGERLVTVGLIHDRNHPNFAKLQFWFFGSNTHHCSKCA
jgi:RHS repeat-associated protein